MVACAESGDFRTPRPEIDNGTFTVQATDVPLSYLRRKNKADGTRRLQRKRVRLTPINEHEEAVVLQEQDRIEEESISPISITLTSPCGESTTISREGSFERTDTPMAHRNLNELKLFLGPDECEEELENIPEHGPRVRDPEVLNMLAELPPRPKCKRKVLPPSITTATDNLKQKKTKLLKLRNKLEHNLENARNKHEQSFESAGYSLSKDLQTVVRKHKLQSLNESRPKSAENEVRVIRLSDLSSTNSSSVPDLPSILNKITKSNSLKDLSRIKHGDHDELSENRTLMYEDSGALSTPRENADKTTPAVEKCLKGSDIASFYNMWDRDRKSRPFDKKDSDKFKINIHRDCLCSIRNCARKCFTQRHSVLPPISPSKDI